MGNFYHHILSIAFAVFSAIPAHAGSSLSNHPVYLALDGVPGSTAANFEVIGTTVVSLARNRYTKFYLMSLFTFYGSIAACAGALD
jgi:hypothetical protein